MTKILEELQARVTDSKFRLDIATKSFQLAQAAFQQAQLDFNIWNNALLAEQRDEQRKVAAANEKQLPLQVGPRSETKSKAEVFVVDAVADLAEEASDNLNKTDTVRDLLRRNPAGMTAVAIWDEVRSDFKHRPYLYSVLKRLRDRDEIVKRRNKYYLKLVPKGQEDQEQPVVH